MTGVPIVRTVMSDDNINVRSQPENHPKLTPVAAGNNGGTYGP